MQSIFFANSSDNREVSIFDVQNGLACNCTCLDCGKPLIAYHGDKKAWHFQHQSYSKCVSAEETSLHKLTKIAFSELSSIALPKVGYLIKDKSVKLCDIEVFSIKNVQIEKTFDEHLRPDVVLIDENNDKVYVEVYVTHKSKGRKVKEYRKLNCKAIEIRFKECDFEGCKSIQSLVDTIKNKLISMDYTYSWLSHPSLNKVIKLLEDEGVRYSNTSGLTKVLCPHQDSIVDIGICKTCPFKTLLSKRELRCKGNLTKEQLLLIDPDVVFPPEEINYAGVCSGCSSSSKTYLDNINGLLYRVCTSCGEKELLRCPLCDGNLSLKRNKDTRFDSCGSEFIGCECCSFTLTYLTSNGSFADEIRFTGGLDKIRSDKERYTKDLISYRRTRKK